MPGAGAARVACARERRGGHSAGANGAAVCPGSIRAALRAIGADAMPREAAPTRVLAANERPPRERCSCSGPGSVGRRRRWPGHGRERGSRGGRTSRCANELLRAVSNARSRTAVRRNGTANAARGGPCRQAIGGRKGRDRAGAAGATSALAEGPKLTWTSATSVRSSGSRAAPSGSDESQSSDGSQSPGRWCSWDAGVCSDRFAPWTATACKVITAP